MAVTNLVVDLLRGLGKCDRLFELVSDLIQLLAFGPVVEGAGDVDLLGRMRPTVDGEVSKVSRQMEAFFFFFSLSPSLWGALRLDAAEWVHLGRDW